MKGDNLPNCPACGGVRWVEDYNQERGEATIKELHEKDCTFVVYWKKLYTPLKP